MSKITKLDDIQIYREALELAHVIYHFVKNDALRREYALIDQIKRAAISVAANIAEGYGRKTKKDFAQFLSIAIGSLNELIAYLDFISLEFHVSDPAIKERCITLQRRTHSFRSYLLKNV